MTNLQDDIKIKKMQADALECWNIWKLTHLQSYTHANWYMCKLTNLQADFALQVSLFASWNFYNQTLI